jgi:hypothetical protein
MNEPEANLQNTGSVDAHEVHESLRGQINLLLGALIVTSFILALYLGVEAKRVWIDYNITKPQADAAVLALDQNTAAFQMELAKLVEFGRTHPDFQKQVLDKYKNKIDALLAAPAAEHKK